MSAGLTNVSGINIPFKLQFYERHLVILIEDRSF